MAARSAPQGNKDTPTRTSSRENAEQATQARQLGQDAGHSRLAENVPSDQTVPEQVYADYAQNYDEDDAALKSRIPDVLLDAPVVSIKDLNFELDALQAKVSLFTKVLDLTELSVGMNAYLDNVKLSIESVDVQALLKVRLENVTAIVDRVLTTIDRNPQIVKEIASGVGSAVEDVGKGAGDLVGEGANEAVSDIGSGTGSAVEDVGEGVGRAVEDVGEVGQGAGQAAEQVGDSAGQVAQGATDAAGEAAGQSGDATGQAPEGAHQEDPGRTTEGTAASGARVLSETTDEAGRTVRRVADESGSVVEQTLTESGEVSEEAVVGETDTAREAGEEKGKVQATPAAERKAEDLGVDLSQVEGTGSGGRITVKDVTVAANQG